ncbi:hypothetical protein ZIOFF_000747 [Zingiber officinale]|uniref:Xyloglucan endotransglucosylase/hydrolase n=2 Tax=Zingiber officinale TaxID=94328 RepID=A0A8J5LRL4_ZINOF|nr:hypothetical protein ZIOFF_000747 [Zingiber officinale]
MIKLMFMATARFFLFSILLAISSTSATMAGNFYQDVDINWGNGRGKILNAGRLLTLSLDKSSGSGFLSKNQYIYGRFEVQLKLVPGNSAGTVTTFYLSSRGPTHDEIDLEFLGNLSGDPYTLHTNVFTQGKGNREQQFKLWFDPTRDFHIYSVLWNPRHIVFYVDGMPIREFKNMEAKGVAYPKGQAMRVYASMWAAEDWATRGGQVKTDWSQAPFTAAYRGYAANGCVWPAGGGAATCSASGSSWMWQEFDATSVRRMKWVQRNYMIYNYCSDAKRSPQGMPPECSATP